jgi:hypothetical protein
MPIFDPSASSPGCAGADLLRSVPGLAKPSSPSFQLLPLDDRGRHRRASVKRASIVLALLGLFCGSAVVMSERPQPLPGAAPAGPPAGAEAPIRAYAEARPVPPAVSPLCEKTYCLWSEDPGAAPAAKHLVADADPDPGAHHGRSC